MNRHYISFGLVLILLSCALLFPLSYVYASEPEQYGYIEICVNGNSKNYVALKNKDNLYLRIEDISEITGYDLNVGDRIAYYKAGNFDSVTVVDIEFDGTTYTMGKEYKVNIIEDDGGTFLPLNEMLYLLHTQWCMEDDRIVIQPLPYTIIDFLGSNYESMWKNKVNQTDLLVNGESKLAHNLRSSLAEVFNDFDPMMFILWWPEEGITPALNKEYEEALLQLAVDDKDFLDSYGQTKIAEDLAQVDLDTIKSDFENMKNVLDIPENLIAGAESIDEVADWISELSNNKKTIKFNSYSDVSYMTLPRINAWSQEIGNITDTLEIANLLINVSEVSQRSQRWGRGFIDQIRVLTDFDNMGYNIFVTNRVKNVASSLIKEYENPVEAASDEAALQATLILLNKVFDESLFGKYFAIFNAGLAISKIDENIKNSIDAADLAYMVDCLVKTEHIAMNEMSRSYSKLLGNIVDGDLTEQDVERLRNCVMLSLRTNLRNHAFIYYLNEKLNDNSNWESSIQAQEIRNQIVNDYVLLCQVMETEPYDKLILLNDFERMYSDEYGMMRQPDTVEAFHEGKIDDFKNVDIVHIYTDFLETQGYQSFISDWIYGRPNEYVILDINGDGIEELIITGGDGWGFYNFSVFSYDKISNDIYALSIPGNVIFGEDYTKNVAQYYGSLWYSSKYHALVFTELNNGSMFDSYGYFVIDNRKLVVDFSVGFERDYETQQISYDITSSGSRETISNDEYSAYISELSTIIFEAIPNSDVPGEIDYEAAKEAILKYYNNLSEDDGTYVIFDDETIENNESYFVFIRYQMSDQEAEEKISNGGFPEANVLASSVTIDKIAGSIYTDDGTIIQ